jgi:hypothetical protein
MITKDGIGKELIRLLSRDKKVSPGVVSCLRMAAHVMLRLRRICGIAHRKI